MNGFRRAALLSFFVFLLAGCAVEPVDDQAVGAAVGAVTADNALIPNALIPNALIPNALIPNALIPNALIPNGLDDGAFAALADPGEAGALSRMFMEYLVGCALTPSQSFSFTWTDSFGAVEEETYVGAVGLAPGWASGPLDVTGQRLVSACLAARTNYYGVTVIISLRSGAPPLDTMTPGSELAAYPDVEGAFWGNLFAPTPELYACFDPANVWNDWDRQRDCAAGHREPDGQLVPCGPIVLTGPCGGPCAELDAAGQYYPWCHADAPGAPAPTTAAAGSSGASALTTEDVITTSLP
jgi:hypothetical protein